MIKLVLLGPMFVRTSSLLLLLLHMFIMFVKQCIMPGIMTIVAIAHQEEEDVQIPRHDPLELARKKSTVSRQLQSS